MARAFCSLHSDGFISTPCDQGELTTMGDFVSQLGVDLQLGRLVGLGAQLDMLAEAAALAAVLSQPKPHSSASPGIDRLVCESGWRRGVWAAPLER